MRLKDVTTHTASYPDGRLGAHRQPSALQNSYTTSATSWLVTSCAQSSGTQARTVGTSREFGSLDDRGHSPIGGSRRRG